MKIDWYLVWLLSGATGIVVLAGGLVLADAVLLMERFL